MRGIIRRSLRGCGTSSIKGNGSLYLARDDRGGTHASEEAPHPALADQAVIPTPLRSWPPTRGGVPPASPRPTRWPLHNRGRRAGDRIPDRSPHRHRRPSPLRPRCRTTWPFSGEGRLEQGERSYHGSRGATAQPWRRDTRSPRVRSRQAFVRCNGLLGSQPWHPCDLTSAPHRRPTTAVVAEPRCPFCGAPGWLDQFRVSAETPKWAPSPPPDPGSTLECVSRAPLPVVGRPQHDLRAPLGPAVAVPLVGARKPRGLVCPTTVPFSGVVPSVSEDHVRCKALALRNPVRVYDILFAAASASLIELGADPDRLGGLPGITAVLHTWTRTLAYHPHVHCIVTGGGLAPDGAAWVPARRRFLFPVKVMGAYFRGKVLAALATARARGQLCFAGACAHLADDAAFARWKDELYRKNWVVDSRTPSAGPNRSSIILAATPTESASPTSASSPSTIAPSALRPRTVAPAHFSRSTSSAVSCFTCCPVTS
jgi:hypothetical protein